MDDLAPAASTLAEHLTRGPLRPEVAARVGVLACKALAEAPARRARRDLGPSAIALDVSPEGSVTVSIRGATDGGKRSPMYVSPEEITHASPPDARSDVYSLCTVLYEALSGTLPFPRCATEEELLRVLISRDPVPLAAAAPRVDPRLTAVVARGLSREPGRRWASPAELCDALAPFTGGSEQLDASMLEPSGEEARVGSERAAAVTGAAPRRRRLVFAAALGLFFGAGIGVGWVVRSAVHVTPPPVASVAPAPPPVASHNETEKRDVAEKLLEGKTFFVYLDPRRPGVVVPEKFRHQSELMLELGRNMPTPIPDLRIRDAGISATLSFSRTPFHCEIPWSAVYTMVDQDGLGRIWEEDMPPEQAVKLVRPPGADGGR